MSNNLMIQKDRILQIVEVLKKYEVMSGIDPEKLRHILEELGPTYVKLGQIMSMRSDLLPESYCLELLKLRSEVQPMSFETVLDTIHKEYGIDDYHEIFNSIEKEPLGSASIAQVHRAQLRDGRNMVIKVQRPGIWKKMSSDVEILKHAIMLLNLNPELGDPDEYKQMVEELWVTAKQEMDFLIEASHLEEFHKLNANIPYVGCPNVEKHLSTSSILVMEEIKGIKLSDLAKIDEAGYDRKELATHLAENYAKQILDDGFFHADPHFGNIKLVDDKIIWLDLGMVGRLSLRDRNCLTEAVKAIYTRDVYQIKNIVLSMCDIKKKVNHPALYNDIDMAVGKYASADFSSINLGRVVLDLNEILVQHHIGFPSGISLLARGMLTFEGVLEEINPEINFTEIVSEHLLGKTKNIDIEKETKELGFAVSYALKKGIDVPSSIADLLKMTIKGQTKINLEITGSEEPLSAINKMVDKIVVAIICSALLIGSSMIYANSPSGNFFGFSTLGGIGFLIAAILGLWLIVRFLKNRNG